MRRSLMNLAGEPAGTRRVPGFIRIPLYYALIAATYIVASSYFFGARLGYSGDILRAEILKGITFVLITAVVLVLLMFRAHQRSRASETAFHDLVQSLPDAVVVVSLPDRRIVFANQACCAIFGYRQEQLIGGCTRLLHVDDTSFEQFDALGAEALRRDGVFVSDFHMRRCDGSVFPSSHMVSLMKAADRQEYAVSLVRDDSERFEQKRKAEESAEQLRLISENLTEVFWIADAAGNLEYLSPAFEKVWGRPAEEMLRNPLIVLDAVHPADRQRVANAIQHAADNYDIHYRMIRPDGEMRWIHGRAVAVKDTDGRTERIVGISADITGIVRQREELRLAQKLQAVGQLTGGVAHDFNNILMVMMGNAEDVAERLSARKIDEPGLAEIIAAGNRARDLTDSLLRFSRNQPITTAQLDVNEAVWRTLTILEHIIGKRVSIETSLTEDRCMIAANPTEFETCLINLVINARDAMPQGGTVTVSTRLEDRNELAGAGDHVVISVADTGQGMSETVRQRALEPFFTTKQAGSGTGLGLSLVNSFAQSAGGTVRILSQPGQGSTIEMHIPCRSGDQAGTDPSHVHSSYQQAVPQTAG